MWSGGMCLVVEEQGHQGDHTGTKKAGKAQLVVNSNYLLGATIRIDFVYLRTGQSPCKLKDRYIHFREGANQLCGRMIARLPFKSERFVVLPPHFPPEVMDKMAIDYWKQIVSGYTNCPRGVQAAFAAF
ncbi:hypothetical protein PC116_g17684 [Phytophthora cactorum]|uniref:Uncharacterized protein n=1 Tax=Phytophthora cactorum TaxID=29920 RepID=A0A8T1G797_9STRA|nr:hypothetical protein PC118_g8849 [Phytophthora cactorum]KAG4234138.1 hypothetical protein PC116_g17684 [Phytophthora cactorum]